MESQKKTSNRSGLQTDDIPVAGFTPLTTIDYPGELAAVVFLQGCPWRCGYCQNSELLPRREVGDLDWTELLSWLKTRTGLLDAVVFSGGEPTLHRGLESAIKQVRSLGYKVGLHTAGIYPQRLKGILPLLDWVGLDIKSARRDYESITGVKGSDERAWKSARYVVESQVDYEFRTTLHPDMLNREQLSSLQDELIDVGAKKFVIQECVLKGCLDESRRISHARKPGDLFLHRIGEPFDQFGLRSS